ncbi:hypothetical protein PENSPDRAFT_749982 [Peniophora sp. CONT]|nr:hypothetical protein PENSPDRAFT_749982 [Peniophora sp. CONT]
MNDAIRAAREHNTRSSIHRKLSIETLCGVFLALALLDVPSLMRPQGWYLQINGVCHRWREVAVNYAELWARSAGSFPSELMTDLAIHRAHLVDLSLDGHCEDYHGSGHVLTPYQIKLIEKHAARLRSFVHDTYTEWSDVLYRVKVFPKLEMARIWDESGPCVWTDLIDTPSLHGLYMNNALIPFNAPTLRHLRIDMDNLDWRRSSDIFSSDEPMNEGCQAIPRLFPTIEFIAFLQRSPQLERLIVTDMPELLSEYLPSAPELYVELPQLRVLHLGGEVVGDG